MDANNVVLLLNELEQLGYVTRLRDPHDRRRHLVELTAAGARGARRAPSARRRRSRTTCWARSTPEERATLRELLTRALRGIEPADEERSYSATIASIST